MALIGVQHNPGKSAAGATTVMKRLLLIFVLAATAEITAQSTPAACTGSFCPTLVQDVSWGTNNGTENGNGFKYHLPNPTLANNLLICGVSWDTAATATITDNIGTNTWVDGPTSTGGSRKIMLKFVLGVAGGTQHLTLTLTAPSANVHFRCSEFYNVATSSAVDGTPTSASNVTGPTVAAGPITTTVNGDLIYHYGVDDANLCCGNAVTSFVVGPNFNLLPSDRHLGFFAQYQVQATAGTINPTMTANQSSHDPFGSAAIAFKAASAGTAPGPNIRILRELQTNNNASGNDFTIQWPCSGNLTVFSQGESNNYHTITSITDTNINLFTAVSRSPGEPYMYYAANTNCSTPNTRTMVVHGNVGGSTASDVIYDIANAAASPFDNRASGFDNQNPNVATASCVLNSASTDHAPDITPIAAPGMAIVVAEEGTGPRCDLYGAGYVMDSGWYTGATDDSTLMDNGNGYGHYYYSTTATIDFHWLWADNGFSSNGFNLAATFKQAPSSGARKRVVVKIQ
jgi:hypothetical protein